MKHDFSSYMNKTKIDTTFHFVPIDEEQTLTIISQLKPKNSMGHDNISQMLLQKTAKYLYPRHTGGAVPLRFLARTAITVVTPTVVLHSFPLPAHPSTAVEPPRDRCRVASLLFAIARQFYTPRHTGGAVPLRFFVKTAITEVTPPIVFNSFPLPVTHLTAVEPPRDRRSCASLHFRDCTAVVLRRHGGDGGATAGARR